MAAQGTGVTEIRGLAIAVMNGNVPVVAFGSRENGRSVLRVRRFNGASWDDMGAPLNVDINLSADGPSMKLDGAGDPWIAFSEGPPTGRTVQDIFVKRWNGTGWQPVGGRLNAQPASYASGPSLEIAPGLVPTVGWTECRMTLKRWTGSDWTPPTSPVHGAFPCSSFGLGLGGIAPFSNSGTWLLTSYSSSDLVLGRVDNVHLWQEIKNPWFTDPLGSGGVMTIGAAGEPLALLNTATRSNQAGSFVVRRASSPPSSPPFSSPPDIAGSLAAWSDIGSGVLPASVATTSPRLSSPDRGDTWRAG